MNKSVKGLMIAFVLVMFSGLVLALAGCGGSSSNDTPAVVSTVQVVNCASVVSAATVTATAGNTFSPTTVTIAKNDVVKWVSASSVLHTVTSGATPGTPDGSFDQSLPSSGSSICLKFTAAGTFNYYCTQHYAMGMTGVVTVN